MTDKQELKKAVILDSIEVSRDSIKVFANLMKQIPSLEDECTELIFIEQTNITKEFKELVEVFRGEE